MRHFFVKAKAKAEARKRKEIEKRLKDGASDNDSSVALADPWNRVRQFTQLANVKSKLGKQLCQHCEWVPPKLSMLHAHHITPRACGGTDDQRNLIVLCPNCHAIAHFVTAQSQLQRQYTGPSTAKELQEWMRLAYDLPKLRRKQRAHLIAGIHPLIDSLHPVHNPHL
jgi:5-methylcytosine-specific restriction endonuclease McrA